MRLRSLLPALAVLALAACDSTGALKVAEAQPPAAKPAETCCCKAAAPVCPPVATPAQPPAMAPEPERPSYRPAAVHRAPAARREAPRRVAYVARGHEAREYGQAREYAYAETRSYAAPAYDGYVDVPAPPQQGQVVIVEDESAYRGGYRETYSEQSEGYAYGGGRYAGGYESHGGGRGCGGCGPREAAGLDRNGFLTWPGKVPARP